MTKIPSRPKEGDAAPDITLETHDGKPFRLSGLKGKNVVLYFYPKASTPGCTTEACRFRDQAGEFAARGAVIVGVSPDASPAQSRFRSKHDLPFDLLCDVRVEAARAYGVWKEKSMYGRKFMGIERSTFLIGADGRIRKVFGQVKPAGHAEEVLQALDELA